MRRTMSHWKISVFAALTLHAGLSLASAQQLNQERIQQIRDTAADICNTVYANKTGKITGQKDTVQLEGDIKVGLGGLVGRLAGAGASGTSSLSHEDFEGLSREVTAAALEGDRGCRERVFNKMFDRLGSLSGPPVTDLKPPLPFTGTWTATVPASQGTVQSKTISLNQTGGAITGSLRSVVIGDLRRYAEYQVSGPADSPSKASVRINLLREGLPPTLGGYWCATGTIDIAVLTNGDSEIAAGPGQRQGTLGCMGWTVIFQRLDTATRIR